MQGDQTFRIQLEPEPVQRPVEQPLAPPAATSALTGTGQEVRNQLPLRIAEFVPSHRRPPPR
jgi:hypothetical protein